MKASSTVLAVSLLLLATCTPRPQGATVLFTGDVLLDRGVSAQAHRHGYDYLWRDARALFRNADAVVVNLECPVTDHWQPVNKRFIFRASPQALPAMKNAGVTHAALANNHTMDQGHRGLADTDSILRRHGITPLGLTHQPRPQYVAPRVAVINALMMPVENWTFASDYANVCCTSPDTLVLAVQRFKRHHPDHHLVALLHWGTEYMPHCTPRQMHCAHRLIDAGADAVVGHHPHVLQNSERYRGRPIYYSLGNFIFDNRQPETHPTGILSLTFGPDSVCARFHPMTIEHCAPRFR